MEAYFNEFIVIEQQLNAELKQKEKEGSTVCKKWKDLNYKFSKKVYTSAVKFDKVDAILEFTIEPIHAYDELVKSSESIQQSKNQKGTANKREVFKKSKAIRKIDVIKLIICLWISKTPTLKGK